MFINWFFAIYGLGQITTIKRSDMQEGNWGLQLIQSFNSLLFAQSSALLSHNWRFDIQSRGQTEFLQFWRWLLVTDIPAGVWKEEDGDEMGSVILGSRSTPATCSSWVWSCTQLSKLWRGRRSERIQDNTNVGRKHYLRLRQFISSLLFQSGAVFKDIIKGF